MTRSTSKLSKALRARILAWDDERDLGNSLIVTLNRGWQFSTDPRMPEHVRGFDSVREARETVRNTVPCDCRDCSRLPNTDENPGKA